MTTTQLLCLIKLGQQSPFSGTRSPDKVLLERWAENRYKLAAQFRWATEAQTLLKKIGGKK